MQPELVDAVVIGSGPGGSVAALRLGQAGYQTVVLERGKRWEVTGDHDTFATYARPDGRSAWLSPKTVDPIRPGVIIPIFTGVLDRVDGDGISVLLPACMGAGSVPFNGAVVEPARDAFSRVLPMCDYRMFHEVYYPRVRSMIGSAPLPGDMLDGPHASPHFESTRLFRTWAQHAGLHTELLDMAMDWRTVREELSGTIAPHVTGGQELWYGDNSGAKCSLEKNYLHLAEALETVDVLPLHEVTSIGTVPDDGDIERYRVSGRVIDTSGREQEEFSFICTYLFVAAGSVKTSELLVRARETDSLPHLNERVGKGWGNNGDAIGVHGGHLSTAIVPQVSAAIGTVFDHPTNGSVRVLGDAYNGGPADALLTLAMALPHSGHFPNKGEFRYDAHTQAVRLYWPKDDPEILHLREMAAQTYAFLDAASSAEEPGHAITHSIDTGLTAHPLGGMVLGEACEDTGRVLGYERLFVVDGSLLPGSSGCANPFLTIAALSEFLVERFLALHEGSAFLRMQ